ncbi:MAG: ATP-binding cassette domain-containing protein [Planctomycetales bacterium]|nr:ATP-binding cassette domain-containing protein [Planctomycetales bacterium]
MSTPQLLPEVAAPAGSPLVELRDAGRMVLPAVDQQAPHGERWVFRHLNLALHAGDWLCLQGPSGGGKSLLLRALAAMDELDEGQLLWLGNSVAPAETPGHRCRVLWLPQRPRLLAVTLEQSLTEVCSFATRRGGRRVDECRREALQLLSAAGRAVQLFSQPADQLSGGELATVALVQALVLAPTVLLLDEPTASADPESTERIESLVLRWAREDLQRAVVWVTHDAQQTRRLARNRDEARELTSIHELRDGQLSPTPRVDAADSTRQAEE